MNQLNRREFLRLGATAAAGAALAACAPKAPATEEPTGGEDEPTAEAPPAETVDLRLSVWADVQDAEVYTNITEKFNDMHEAINVSFEQYAGGYYEKIQANFAGGDSADVLYYQGWIWQSYAENGVISPWDEYVEADGYQDKWVDNDNYRNTTEWGGEKYMTPTDVGALVIYYNKDIFDMQGIPYPERGWTWEDYQEIVQQLSFEDGGTTYYGWAQAGGWNGAYGRVVNFLRRNGHVEWDQVVEPTEARWDHPDIISALQFVVYDTIDNGWCPSPEMVSGGGVGVDNGNVAMVEEGPWYMPRLWGELATLEESEGINFDVVEPPVGSDGLNHSFGHVHGHCLATMSEHKDEAWELVKYILDDEGQTIIAEGGRMCGHPDNIDAIWAPIASERYNFENTEAFSNGMREGSTPVILGEGATINAYGGDAITNLWDKLLGLQATAEEAVPVANEEIQAELDDYWAERS